MRHWDGGAGREVAGLKAARQRDEWRADERMAELEGDLDDSRELRGRLESKLRAKRAELARLRTEHADLLRRYATAESERARALERRRQLALEKPVPGVAGSPVGPEAYAKAGEALRNLGRNAARQQALRTVEQARLRDAAGDGGDDSGERLGRHSADRRRRPALPSRRHQLVPAVAAAVLPYAGPKSEGGGAMSRAQGGFDFFGTKSAHAETDAAETDAAEAVVAEAAEASDAKSSRVKAFDAKSGADLADVVGDEALAEHEAVEDREVIDLTAHDQTEQINVVGLRPAKTS
jgi:hypothetical protein